jgi:hypothetical protein
VPRRRLSAFIALTAAAVLAGGLTAPSRAAAAGPDDGDGNARLAAKVMHAIDVQHFQDILDTNPLVTASAAATTGPSEKYDPGPAELASRFSLAPAVAPVRIHQTPNVDAMVIELDRQGRPGAVADVLLSPQYPKGVVVPLDRNMFTDKVRWQRWDDTQWDTMNGNGTMDILPGREQAPLQFMSPYPASVLKLMVGFGILRLADQGRLSLADQYAYNPVTIRPACGGAVTKPIRQFFDEMITVSKNESTCALIKLIWDLKAMDELNQTFVDLGMPTLQLIGTNPDNGGVWGMSNMSAMDTAKLLLLINSEAERLWTTPAGKRVGGDVLRNGSRQFFLGKLRDQGHNEMLSTTNWCDRAYPARGIPQITPQRWINPVDGTMTVDGAFYGQDVRPCNATAEVTFAHKNGWVDTAGNDAGIVHSLPGKERRNYIVAVFSNLGFRYVDANRPADPPGITPVLFSEKFARLGVTIDDIVMSQPN